MLLTLMTGCNAIPDDPDPAHGEHGLTHHTPQTHGYSIDVGSAEPRVAQDLQYVPVMAQTAKAARVSEYTRVVFAEIAEHEESLGGLLRKTVRGDGDSLILIVEQLHEGELEA